MQQIYLYWITILFTAISIPSNAQVTIGSRKVPEQFSILELDTSDKGLRLNQLNNSQRDILTQKLIPEKEKSKGLSIYNIETGKMQYWEGTKWLNMIGLDSIFSSDMYLQSKGNNKMPEWSVIKFPIVKKGGYYLYSATVKDDKVGCVLSDLAFKYISYNEKDEFVDTLWTVIDGLTTDIYLPEVKNIPQNTPANKVSLVFETSIQMGTGLIKDKKNFITQNGFEEITVHNNSYISFAIGFFIGTGDDIKNYKLYLVRSDKIDAVGESTSVKTYNIKGTLLDLPFGHHTIKIAAMRRTQDDNMNIVFKDDTPSNILNRSLAIGTKIPGTSIFSDFMMRSFLRVETFILDWD